MAIWRATLIWKNTFELSFGQNVLHFNDPTNALTTDQIGGIIDNSWWGTNATPALRAMTANMTSLDFINLQRIDTNPAGGIIGFSSSKTVGNLVSNVWHEVVGYIFQLFDGFSGVRHRGRVYHYGTPSANGGNTRLGPGPATVTAFNTLRTHWLARFGPQGDSGLKWVIWHRGQVGDARWTQVSDIRISSKMGVQRRRNPGVGF